jgi:sulfatase maturation enzyme AslB (radical SAM superfamily)
MGAFELRRRIELKGHTAEILDWFTYWTHDDLKEVISTYFNHESNPVIAISTPFNTTDVHKIKSVLVWAKDKFSNLKIIHGGSRTFDETLTGLVDVFFLGRSMQMFDAWIDNKDLSQYVKSNNPLVLVNNNFDEKIDNPVLPILKDSDLLTSKDILGFEVGVGCKFNCTFCNYELRNAKVTKLIDPYDLREYLNLAHKKYGVTNYFASDDTLNESDEKLEIVAEAISGLDYHPNITAYARLDIISARPSQLRLLEQIQFRSLFFGIESFNNEASKLVRKKSGLDNNYDTLLKIKTISPDTYTVGGIIIGLNKDSEKSIRESIKKIVDEKLLNSIQLYPLLISKANTITSTDYLSDLDKDPNKFGYKIINISSFHHDNKHVPLYHWQSDWADSLSAGNLTEMLEKEYKGKIDMLGHLEYAGYQSLGIYRKNLSYDPMKNQSSVVSTQLKQNYIKSKRLTIK